jgi:hypothetical protein
LSQEKIKHFSRMNEFMSIDKTIRRFVDPARQQMEAYRYWQSLPLGDRLSAVWDVSEAAYSFAAAFKGGGAGDTKGSERVLTRVQRTWR